MMATLYKSTSNDARQALQEFDARVRLARASELALLNHLHRAEELLCAGGVSKASAEELDLLARIHVRQGRYEDARKRWEQAISRDESSRSKFEDCLRELEAFSAKQMKRRLIEWWVTVCLLAFSLLLGIWILVQLNTRS
jgi:tetratricopeptide (TPR) repeat protein